MKRLKYLWLKAFGFQPKIQFKNKKMNKYMIHIIERSSLIKDVFYFGKKKQEIKSALKKDGYHESEIEGIYEIRLIEGKESLPLKG